MTISRRDRWTALEGERAVADAAERLRQMASTRSEQQAMARWLDVLDPQPGECVLDLGAGIGDMSLAFARRIAPDGRVHALDLAPGLLDYAEEGARAEGLGPHVYFDVGDACDLPYEAGSFDAAFCRWVLLHLPDPERAVAEMRRVVRPGGRILCVEVDWATLTVEPGDPAITGQIVRANVERQVDGRSGYRLPELLGAVGLEQLSVIPLTAADSRGDWLPFLESRLTVALEAGIPREPLTQWWQSVQAGAEQGNYRFGFTQYGVIATVPDSDP